MRVVLSTAHPAKFSSVGAVCWDDPVPALSRNDGANGFRPPRFPRASNRAKPVAVLKSRPPTKLSSSLYITEDFYENIGLRFDERVRRRFVGRGVTVSTLALSSSQPHRLCRSRAFHWASSIEIADNWFQAVAISDAVLLHGEPGVHDFFVEVTVRSP